MGRYQNFEDDSSFSTINKDLCEEYVSDQCGILQLDSSCCVQRWSDSLQYERQLSGYSCQNKKIAKTLST